MITTFRCGHNVDVPDREIAWVINAYNCYDQLEWCMSNLRSAYPSSRVVIVSDGDDVDYRSITHRYGCHHVVGEHLHTLETCDGYVRRSLSALLDGIESYCFKIDPDTKVWRRFMRLPSFSSIFGSLETVSEAGREPIGVPANVQGGFIGMTRDAVESMLKSDSLSYEHCTLKCLDTWARCIDMMLTVNNKSFCDDFLISWLANDVGIPIVGLEEVRSFWRRTPVNVDAKYAVTHPHKIVRRPDGSAAIIAK